MPTAPAPVSAPAQVSDTGLRNQSLAGTTAVPAGHPEVALGPRQLRAIALRLAARDDLWRPLLQVHPERRWYARLDTGDGWEAWLLTWSLGQGTDLHDHGGSSGAFTVLSGSLQELTPAPTPADPARLTSRTLAAGGVRTFGPSYLHQVIGVSPSPAASLHVYGPALTVMNRYVLDPEHGPVLAETDRAGADW